MKERGKARERSRPAEILLNCRLQFSVISITGRQHMLISANALYVCLRHLATLILSLSFFLSFFLLLSLSLSLSHHRDSYTDSQACFVLWSVSSNSPPPSFSLGLLLCLYSFVCVCVCVCVCVNVCMYALWSCRLSCFGI